MKGCVMEASRTGWAGTQRQATGPQPALPVASRKAGFSAPLVSCWNAPPQGGCFRFVLRFADDKHTFHPAQNIRRLDRCSELILSEPLVDPISAPDPQVGPIWLLLGRGRGQKVLDVSARQIRLAGGENSSKAHLYSQALMGF